MGFPRAPFQTLMGSGQNDCAVSGKKTRPITESLCAPNLAALTTHALHVQTSPLSIQDITENLYAVMPSFFDGGADVMIVARRADITFLIPAGQNRWSDNPDTSLGLAKQNAELAIEKNPTEPFARLVAAWTAMFERDLDRAKSEADNTLALNPNSSGAYVILGHIETLSGRPLEAIPALERAIRLDPAFRAQHLHFLGMAYLLAGKYETAAALLKELVILMPGTDFGRVILASALGHLGDGDEARRIWKELIEINPKYSFTEHFARQPFKNEEDVRRIAEGLAKAGLTI
jgi:tetratricopeptide (TPR) repeat protein